MLLPVVPVLRRCLQLASSLLHMVSALQLAPPEMKPEMQNDQHEMMRFAVQCLTPG